jgi:signal transduction histidine kinase
VKQAIISRFVMIALATGILSVAGLFLWVRLTGPSDGERIALAEPVWQSRGLPVLPLRGRTNVLQPGDIVVGAAGRSMEEWALAIFDPVAVRPNWQPGQPMTYRVIRNGREQELSVPLTPGALSYLSEHWGELVFGVVFLLIVTFVYVRRPDELAVRPLFISAACALSSAIIRSLEMQLSDFVFAVGLWFYIFAGAGVYLLYYVSLVHFALVFPQRHPFVIKHAWAILLVYMVPYTVCLVVLSGAWFARPSVLNWLNYWGTVIRALDFVCLCLAVSFIIAGYKRTRDVVARQQAKWVVFAAAATGSIIIVFRQLPGVIIELRPLDANGAWTVALFLPLAIAAAILRYHLFDIDLIINRTLVYGLLTVLIAAIYVLLVGSLGLVFQAGRSLWTSLVATGLVAVLFQPLRDRVQRRVNRLMYGEVDDPYAVLSRLGQRLETSLAHDSVLSTIVETVALALKLPYAAIALRKKDTFLIGAAYGLPTDEMLTLALDYQGENLGQLILAPRARGEPFTPADHRLLDGLVHQVAIAVHAVRLTSDLQRSREELVTTREEERRRLRRDLHDGLGQALAGQALQLDVLRTLVVRDPAEAETLAADLKTQVQTSLADIRRLVYALRPPELDELGLVGALGEHVAHLGHANALSISVEAPTALPPLAAAVEVAAYRIVLEALTNVLRHAQAQHCHIRLSAEDRLLYLQVADDGCGLPVNYQAGVGLTSIRERAAELGGACLIEHLPSGGTRIVVQLPLLRQ